MSKIYNITRRKGDTYPISLSTDLDATGNSYILYVTAENDPSDTDYILEIVGAINGDPTLGDLLFPVSDTDAATVGTNYYTVIQTSGTELTTVIEGAFAIDYGSILVAGINSYSEINEAEAYFNTSTRSEKWDSFGLLKKQQGLIEATRILEREPWAGEKEISTQPQEFPRVNIEYRGEALTGAKTLAMVKEGQFELALSLLLAPALINKSTATGSNIKSAGAGPAKVEFFRYVEGDKFPVTVLGAIKPLLGSVERYPGGTGGSFSCGVDETSSFINPDRNGVQRG